MHTMEIIDKGEKNAIEYHKNLEAKYVCKLQNILHACVLED